MFKRLFATLVLGGGVVVASVAAAAALDITNESSVAAQAGELEGLQCDDSGVQLYPLSNWDGSPVNNFVFEQLNVSGIDSDCAGNTLKVVLTDLNGNFIVQGNTTIGADPAVVTFSPAPLTEDVHDIHLSIQN